MRPDLINASRPLMLELEHIARRLRASTVKVQRRRSGGGAGVIWRSDGLIVTNAHVAPGAQATVRLADGSMLTGTVTARDYAHDLAALWVEAHDLPAAAVGDSDALLVGQLVLALGNPRRAVGALRIGIVHSFGRATGSGRRWVEADIDLPPGYSGGPLGDAAGRVVGINSMAARDGRGFAVPSKTVETFLGGLPRQAMGSNRTGPTRLRRITSS
ncbi:MAG TPA: trypsin-like peptidase domain-containing protein [Xanthobacteraceae bacterium]|nr:trypsin-like peptidase domain-containing protein [Xanthobacteraceae bacterium]